jgi:excisionase family DNA binding protein
MASRDLTCLTLEQAAELLAISRRTLDRLIKQGEIRYVRVGRHRRIRRADLADYLDGREMAN